jgi:hypothetical protein
MYIGLRRAAHQSDAQARKIEEGSSPRLRVGLVSRSS